MPSFPGRTTGPTGTSTSRRPLPFTCAACGAVRLVDEAAESFFRDAGPVRSGAGHHRGGAGGHGPWLVGRCPKCPVDGAALLPVVSGARTTAGARRRDTYRTEWRWHCVHHDLVGDQGAV